MNDVWDHDSTDHDGDGSVAFDLSEEFRETGDEPDHVRQIGNFDVYWSVGAPVTIPDRWIDPTYDVPVAIPVDVFVTRTGDDSVSGSVMSVQFFKYWVTDS